MTSPLVPVVPMEEEKRKRKKAWGRIRSPPTIASRTRPASMENVRKGGGKKKEKGGIKRKKAAPSGAVKGLRGETMAPSRSGKERRKKNPPPQKKREKKEESLVILVFPSVFFNSTNTQHIRREKGEGKKGRDFEKKERWITEATLSTRT